MIQALARKLTNHFFDDKDKYPIEVYAYGIELLISTVITTLLITLAGILTNSFFECVIFQAAFSLIRVYTGGYHCMTYINVSPYPSFPIFWCTCPFFGGRMFLQTALFSSADICLLWACPSFLPLLKTRTRS